MPGAYAQASWGACHPLSRGQLLVPTDPPVSCAAVNGRRFALPIAANRRPVVYPVILLTRPDDGEPAMTRAAAGALDIVYGQGNDHPRRTWAAAD